jgi:hypothetical protein
MLQRQYRSKKKTAQTQPSSTSLESRPFAPPQPAFQTEPPNLQTQLETAQRFGHHLVNIPLTSPIQTKLTLGKVGDKYEQEADQVAHQVVQQIQDPLHPSVPVQPLFTHQPITQTSSLIQCKYEVIHPKNGQIVDIDTMTLDALLFLKKQLLTQSIFASSPQKEQISKDIKAVEERIARLQPTKQPVNNSSSPKAEFTYKESKQEQEESTSIQSEKPPLPSRIHKPPLIPSKPLALLDPNATGIPWESASSAKPTEEGAMGGVIFIKIGQKLHVLKAIAGSVAPVLFAEKIMADIGGADTTESKPIQTNSPEGQRILRMLKIHQKMASNNPQLAKTWKEKLPFFENSTYLVVQKAMDGREFGQLYKDDPLSILKDQNLLYNIGKSLAADSFIGNADRFETMNTGNAFVTPDSKIGAIDSTAILQEYGLWKDFDDLHQSWIKVLIEGGQEFVSLEEQEKGRKMAPSASVEQVFVNFEKWFENNFKDQFTRKHPEVETKIKQDSTFNWDTVKTAIKAGLKEGINLILKNLSGSQYQEIKKTFESLGQQYGQDPNYNLNALKVRGDYIRAIEEGKTHDQAYQQALKYSEYKQEAKSKTEGKDPLSEKVRRVLKWGREQGILNNSDSRRLKGFLQDLSTKEQETIIHVRGFTKKLIQKSDAELENRLEAIRVALLQNFLKDLDAGNDLKTALKMAEKRSDKVINLGASDTSFLFEKNKEKLRQYLQGLGVDVAKWGPK